jgi:phosphoglycerol transferase MdoB-like AlkP superfamily enzyme
MKMYTRQLAPISQRFIAYSSTLFALILMMRFYELYLITGANQFPTNSWQPELKGVLNDLVFFIKISSLLALPFFIFYLIKPALASIFYFISALIIVLLSYVFAIYFSLAKVPFGAEFFGYSMEEMRFTMQASGHINVYTLFLGIVFMCLTIVAMWYSGKIKINPKVAGIFCLGLFPALLLVKVVHVHKITAETLFQSFLASNKVLFFMESAEGYYKKNNVNTAHEKGDGNTIVFSNGNQSQQFEYVNKEYPFLHKENTNDVLGVFFNKAEEAPNFVFIIVEGLGRAYSGKNAYLGSYTPFLDSLMGKSLYWENMLSTSGRTFSVIPSVFGSLPFGKNGFAEMGEKMPAHQTLIQFVKENGYETSFYCGTDPHFDNIDIFLKRQHIDHLIGKDQFGPEYKELPSRNGFSWGFGDKEIFKKFLSDKVGAKKVRRLDILLTIATHEPFLLPDQEYYLDKFQKHLKTLNVTNDQKQYDRQYAAQFASLLYFDDALRNLMQAYKKLPDYKNTIFIITGDHRMPEIPISTQLDRFHVPLVIWSPLLKEAKCFKSISSHFDITPSMTAFLRENYQLKFPVLSAWIGHGLDTGLVFRNKQAFPLMRNKSEFVDFVEGEDFISGGNLYKIYPSMDIEASENENRFSELDAHFEQFRARNALACKNGKIIPDSLIKK